MTDRNIPKLRKYSQNSFYRPSYYREQANGMSINQNRKFGLNDMILSADKIKHNTEKMAYFDFKNQIQTQADLFCSNFSSFYGNSEYFINNHVLGTDYEFLSSLDERNSDFFDSEFYEFEYYDDMEPDSFDEDPFAEHDNYVPEDCD